MQRITTLFVVLLFGSTWLSAQISDDSAPFSSYSTQRLSANIPTVVAPELDQEQVAYQDSIDNLNGAIPKIGQLRPVQVNPSSHGQWENLLNGDRIWRVRILANGAQALNLYFDDFYLPPGAKLHVYGDDRYQVIGGFTSRNNHSSGYFATELIFGEALIVEYYEPAAVRNKGRLNISEIGHVHRNARNYTNPNAPTHRSTGFGGSDPCQVNVNCTEGVGKEPQRDATARVLVRVGANQGWCSGSLVNNVRQDCTPYFLTALHCGVDTANNVTNAADFNQWVFYFKFQGPGCSNPPVQGSLANNTMTGCALRAESNDGGGNSGSDMLLVEFNNSVPQSYDPYYAGWDANNVAATGGYGIHHPSGDIKKISTYSATLSSTSWGGTVPNTHWLVTWIATTHGHGVTEGGSSGSAIFNNAGQIVGTLTGGSSFCTNTSAPDLYGKMSYHWASNGTTAATRLRDWLDPDNTGTLTLGGTYSPCASAPDDAGITAFNNPTDGSTYCSDSIAPEVVITNIGGNTLTSATINYQVGAGPINTFNWTGNLTTGATDNVTLPLTPVPTTGAPVNFTAYTTLPNGNVDTVSYNDTTIISASYEIPNALPYAEAFDAGTLPADISTINPDGDAFEWVYSTAASGYATGTGSMFYDNYNGSVGSNPNGTDDYFLLPTLDLSSASSATLTFDVAYARYVSGATFISDSLIVAVVTGCDGPMNIAFQEGGATLETNGASNSAYVPSTAADWATKTVDLTPYVGESHVQIYFINRSAWGNSLYVDNINISSPCNLTASAAATNASCAGLCDGDATATPNNGTAPFSYVWSNGQTGATATGLCAGAYSVTISDAASCTATASVTLTEPSALTASTSSTDESGFGNDGTATVSPNGGTTPYSYLWSDGQNTATATGLVAGNYTVTTTDANGCSVSSSATVNGTVCNLTASATGTDASCAGACDGTATVTAASGTMPYVYAWDNGQTTATATGLCAATHSVTVTDALGCTAIDAVTTGEPTVLTATTSSTDESGFGNDGTATAAPSGGTMPYSYLWSDGQTTATATGLSGGSYDVTVSDANACSLTETVVVNTITCNATVNISASSDATCNGLCDGTATAAPANGTAPYSYLWSNGETTETATALCAGTVQVTITDVNGCTATNAAFISQPMPMVLSLSTNDEGCAGNDGSATVSVSMGQAPYSFLWSNGATTLSAVGLNAGAYQVTVTDNNGCTISSSTTVNNNCGSTCTLTAFMSATDAQCGGSCDGTATATPNGGTAPFTYLWSNNATTASLTGLCAGTYDVTITDAASCTTTGTATVNQPTSLLASISGTSDETCAGNDGAATAAPTGGIAPYTYLWADGQTTATATGLAAGNYALTVTDANGCLALGNATVNNNCSSPCTLSLSFNDVDASCATVCDGNSTANVTGGTAPYTYLWNDGTTTATLTGLCQGGYGLTVTDATGCTVSGFANINEPIPLAGNINNTPESCAGSDGTANMVANSGTAPYSYLWSDGQTSATATGLAAGSYDVTVTDANGCSIVESTTVNNGCVPCTLTASTTVANASCAGNCDGTATVVTSAGTSPFTYLWSNGQITETAVGLCPGSYTVTVTDFNGCTATAAAIVTQPTALGLTIGSQTNVDCNGNATGEVVLAATGGTPPYEYSQNGVLFQTVDTFSNLSAGPYTFTVRDDNGCTATVSTTISQPSALITAFAATDETCAGNDGTATANVSGGTAAYGFLWSDGQTTQSATGLVAGTYNVTVTDANGCVQVTGGSVNNGCGGTPCNLASSVSTTDALCAGSCDGTATVTPSLGAAPYSYIWNNGQTTQTATGLCAGSYFVTVTDVNGCTLSDVGSVHDPAPLVSNASSTSETCAGNDGTAALNPAGGTAPYSFNWSTGAATASLNGLNTGSYAYTVTDANNCTTTGSVNVNNGCVPCNLTASASSTNELCAGACDGTATVTQTGGTAPFVYLWSTGAPTSTVTGLCPGTYSVTVFDANGCSAVATATVTSAPSLFLSASSVQSVSCNGGTDGSLALGGSGGTPPYEYSQNGVLFQTSNTFNNLMANNYNFTVRDANGCTVTQSFTVSEPAALQVNFSISDETCIGNDGSVAANVTGGVQPLSYSWSTGSTGANINSLTAGTYNLTVTDANGCSVVQSAIVNNNCANCTFNLTATATDATCNGACDGSISLNTGTGTAPFNYLWSNGATGSALANQCAGTYSVTVSDASGCFAVDTVVINEPTAIVPNTTTTATTCAGGNGSATVAPTGGTAPYTYAWPTGQTTATATGLNAQTYSLTITDATGCASVHSVVVPNGCFCNIQANIVSVPTSCLNTCDGGAYVTVTSGLAPYSYAWSTGATTDTVVALCNGPQSVTVTDANNCTAVFSTVIASPSGINSNVTSSSESCAGNDGIANVFAAGGALGYSYAWSNGATGSSITGLSQGSYTVTITDQNGCTATNTATVPLDNSSLANNVGNAAVLAAVSCNGGIDGSATIAVSNFPTASYAWSNGETQDTAVALPAGVNYVTVSTPVGCAVIDSVVIIEPAPLAVNTVVNTTACIGNSGQIAAFAAGGTGPYSFAWSNGDTDGFIDSLVSGPYTATITDANGCIFSFTDTVPAIPVGPQVTTANTTAPLCSDSNDGAIDIDVSPAGNYLFSWSNGATTEDLSNAPVGIHTVIVTDTSIGGCFTIYTDTLTGPAPLAININRTPASSPTASDGLISATVSGGTWPYNFFWNTGAVDSVLTGMPVGNYSLVLIDANGCSDSLSFQLGATTALGDVSEVTAFELFPNPNAGQFQVNLELAKIGEMDLQVLDMLGRVLYEQHLEGDTFNLPMDFSSLPAGTYVLMIQTEKGRMAKRVVIRR